MGFARGLILLCALVVSGTPLRAQETPPDTVRVEPSLFQRSDLWLLAGFTGATIAMFPLDREVATALRDSSLVANNDIETLAKTFGFLGSPGPFIIGGTMYVIGRYGGMPRMAHLAVHGTEAIVVGVAATGVLKAMLGRSRPFVSADTNPADFELARGFRADKYQAFPSGHATTAFAVAAAVSAETAEWWPRSRWIVGPVLYGGAGLVGLSRMYEDKHWASDVVMGAAIGVFAGLKTVRFNHTRAGNRLDRWLLGDDAVQLRVAPGPAGTLSLGVRRSW